MSEINIPNTVLISFAHPGPSYGVNLISAVLKQSGYPVSTIYFPPQRNNSILSDREYNALVEKCFELEPDIVGISLMSSTYSDAIHISSELKKKKKDLLIVWGGIHPTLEPELCLEHADIVCRGEGEEATLKLVRAVQLKTSYDNIENLWIRKKDEILKNPAALITDLDTVPFADQECRDKYILSKNEIIDLKEQSNTFFLMTSRGCHFSCFFCSNQAIKEVYNKYRVRRRSVDNVINELRLARKSNQNITDIFICDDIFTYDLDWVKDFSEKYKKEIGLPFQCFTHPEFAKEEMIKTIKDTGCNNVSMGINGCNKRMRMMFNRKSSDKTIITACQVVVKNNFKFFNIDIILSPFDTKEDRQEGLEFLLKLPKPFFTNLNYLTFFPQTDVAKMGLEMGMVSKEEIIFIQKNNPFKNYKKIFFSRDGKWWALYTLCGKNRVPNWLIKIAVKIPVLAISLFAIMKLYEIQSQIVQKIKS
ncbi:MAG: radical SAM protein [Pseudomonadota bacterium]